MTSEGRLLAGGRARLPAFGPGTWHTRTVRVGDGVLQVTCLEDFEAAVAEAYAQVRGPMTAKERADLCPLFGALWPAAGALATVAAEGAEGLQVLEIGCGLALPSLAAARAGARVVATDLHPGAGPLLAHNARQNGTEVAFQPFDWRIPTTLGRFDRVIGSDVLYEPGFPDLVAQVCAATLKPDGVGLIADPGRLQSSRFPDAARAAGLQVTERLLEHHDDLIQLFILTR